MSNQNPEVSPSKPGLSLAPEPDPARFIDWKDACDALLEGLVIKRNTWPDGTFVWLDNKPGAEFMSTIAPRSIPGVGEVKERYNFVPCKADLEATDWVLVSDSQNANIPDAEPQ